MTSPTGEDRPYRGYLADTISQIRFLANNEENPSSHGTVSIIKVWKTRSLMLIFWKASKIKCSISYLWKFLKNVDGTIR
jgi:hypothetical protein